MNMRHKKAELSKFAQSIPRFGRLVHAYVPPDWTFLTLFSKNLQVYKTGLHENPALSHCSLLYSHHMCPLMALWAKHNKVLWIVAVEQISGNMLCMELERIKLLSTLRTDIAGLFAQRGFKVVHLRNMNGI